LWFNKLFELMPTHVPKRIYTASALEEWFGRLGEDWEKTFGDHELALGGQLYQAGAVSSIELQKGHAIINGKVDKKDLYALIEWEGAQATIRSSSSERLSGQALAVAGLYEIEELLADSVSPLPPDTSQERQSSSGGFFAVGSSASRPAPLFGAPPSRPLAPRPPPPSPAARAQAAASSRSLLIRFHVEAGALAFDAYWRSADGLATEPALKMYPASAGHINETERERLIRLTALARKSGFELDGKTHDYTLSDLSKIPDVVRNDLDIWKKYFHIELSAAVAALGRGVQTITVEVEAAGEGSQLNFRWIFLLGSRELAPAHVRTLLSAGRQAVVIDELGLVKLADEQADVLADWREVILDGSGVLPRYMLFSLFRQDALPIRLSGALESWTRSLMSPPATLPDAPAWLRDYQGRGVAWLNHLLDHDCHPLLADEMGLGKTVQMLTLLSCRLAAQPSALPSLIVAPASVIPVWSQEVALRFPHLSLNILTHDNPLTAQSTGLWLASYGQVKRHEEILSQSQFQYIILDEAQMIKNPRTKAARACYGLRGKHRLALTGTPVENRPLDLWSVMRFLMPGLLGGSQRFDELAQDDPSRLIQRLHQQVSPFILRRTKAEVARELPEKVEATLVAPLSPTQRAHYARLVEQGVRRFGTDIRKASQSRGLGFFTLLTRLRQASCDAGLLPWVHCPATDSGKVATLLDKLEGITSAGSKVVIFSQFVGFLNRIQAALEQRFPQLPRYTLTGATLDRQKPVSDFQSQSGPAIMLVSLRAGGTGITLHAADYLFLMDPWWNPAVEAQAIDRVHRLGQKKTVFVYRVVSEGTVEARIQELKAQKRELFATLVGNVRDNTHFALYFKSLQELISLGSDSTEAEETTGEE
jgi:superfamily II DNA or RNA helicase